MGCLSRLPGLACALVAAMALPTLAAEVIREHDAAGRVRIVREVTEDAGGNCVNHGLWQMLDADGRLAAEGRYELGLRTGVWRRWLSAADIPPESMPLFAGFDLPLASQVEFSGGLMNGTWSIADAGDRRCLALQFQDGRRHGQLCRWSPSGTLIHRATYQNGLIDGEEFAWNRAKGVLEHNATWVDGYHLVRSVAYHPSASSDRRSEGNYLLGPRAAATTDDFWTMQFAQYRFGQDCIPHGPWRHWHPGGQLAAQGRYSWGRPVGEFVWRHPNGQKAAMGAYSVAGRPAGVWRWWDANGALLAGVSPGGTTSQTTAAMLETAQQPAGFGETTRR